MSAILLGYQCLKRIKTSQTSFSSENNVVSIVNTRRRSLRYHKNDVCLKRKGTRLDNPYVVGPWHLLRRNSNPVLPQGTSGIKRVRTRNESAVVDTPAKPKKSLDVGYDVDVEAVFRCYRWKGGIVFNSLKMR